MLAVCRRCCELVAEAVEDIGLGVVVGAPRAPYSSAYATGDAAVDSSAIRRRVERSDAYRRAPGCALFQTQSLADVDMERARNRSARVRFWSAPTSSIRARYRRETAWRHHSAPGLAGLATLIAPSRSRMRVIASHCASQHRRPPKRCATRADMSDTVRQLYRASSM
jgi:hypothetical protein